LRLVTLLLPEAYLEGLDRLVELGRFQSRSDALRDAVKEMINGEQPCLRVVKTIQEIPIALGKSGQL